MFEIRSTTNGPVIIHDGEFVVLSDDDALVELCEKDESLIEALEEHVKSELRSAVEAFLDAADSGINPPPTKIYSYINATQSLWIFENHRWPAYLDALEGTEEGQ